jgi:hypothetical protein
MVSGAFLVVPVVLIRALGGESPTLSVLALVVGVLAGLVQVLGLLRWVYLVPALARVHADPEASDSTRAAVDVTFRAFHQYLGVRVGEHLGYFLTGAWSVLVGLVVVQGDVLGAWLCWLAIPIGAGLVVASAEFLGPKEKDGWHLAGAAVPILYVLSSAWLFVAGIALIA